MGKKGGRRAAPAAHAEAEEDVAAMEVASEEMDGDGVVQFAEGEDNESGAPKKLTGRRAKREREAKQKNKPGTFESMGLCDMVLKAIKRKGFRLPTPIQRRAMPIILQGSDVIGMARTGSGKTAAFVIPLVERLKAHSIKAGARALLLSPTRELALQTHKAVREMTRFTDLRTAVLVGGDAMEAQFAELAANPDVLVATPGRLLHHLGEVTGMSLKTVEYFVLDEADRLFEMGFAEQIKEILGKLGDRRQSLLFSATLPRSLADFAAAGLTSPQLVRLDTERRVSPDLSQLFFTVRQEDKVAALLHLVQEVVPAGQLTIVFVATKHHVEYLAHLMARENIQAACVYGSMDQTARKIQVAKFRAKKVGLLITTDVAARGIDIPLIDNVINVDFPCKPELFVHRVGRAARMGRPGTAFSLLTRDELPYLLDLHLYLGRRVQPAAAVPKPEELQAAAAVLGAGGVAALGMAAAGDVDAPAVYGSYPAPLLALPAERLRVVEAEASELVSMHRSLTNAFALYVRTRPAASTESVNRAKQLSKEGQHPALLSLMPQQQRVDLQAEAQLAQFTSALRSFRPVATVFEAEVAGVKSAAAADAVVAARVAGAGGSGGSAVMSRKRAAHGSTIAREREKRARSEAAAAAAAGSEDDEGGLQGEGRAGASSARQAAMVAMEFGDGVLNEGKYRDTGLYIGHTRGDMADPDESFALDRGTAELAEAVLDLTAEDQEGMAAASRRFHWDVRKKKYVQLRGKDATAGQAKKRVRTESGATVISQQGKQGDRSKSLYQKWVKTQRKRVAATGSMEDNNSGLGARGGGASDALAKRFDKAMKHTSWKASRTGAGEDAQRGERLKSKDQVRKALVKAARRKEWLQSKQQSKGAAGGGGGGTKKKPHKGGAGGGTRGVVQKRRGTSGGGGRGSKGKAGRH